MSDREKHDYCTRKFIDLANELNAEGLPRELVNAALIAASGIYLTYTAAGNSGALEPSGVDKAVNYYRRSLEHIQKRKKEEVAGGDA